MLKNLSKTLYERPNLGDNLRTSPILIAAEPISEVRCNFDWKPASVELNADTQIRPCTMSAWLITKHEEKRYEKIRHSLVQQLHG